MSALEYSVIVERPLYEVLTHLGKLAEVEGLKPRSPSGGMRFEVVARGTRITVIGEDQQTAPNLLAALIQSLPGRMQPELPSSS